MRSRSLLPWLIGLSLLACLASLGLAVHLGLAARSDAAGAVARRMAAEGNTLAREIEADLALFDLALREAVEKHDGADTPSAKLLGLPLTARYVGFMDVLNEAGDVVADSRSNVSRPANFAGRDYFQDQLKNPSDSMLIGRPFGTAPNQHASIPLSRRRVGPDGAFAGVVVAGVRLAWLSDLLSRQDFGASLSVVVRRADGLVLMRSPYDEDVIGRNATRDPAWRDFLRTGLSTVGEDGDGIRLFSPVGRSQLVLELSMDRAGVYADTPPGLTAAPLLVLVPALCALALGFAAHRLLLLGRRLQSQAGAANEERMRLLATMSHELRSPLTGVLGLAEMMAEEGGLNPRQTAWLARLTEAGTLMRNIVNRVIDMAHPADREEQVTPEDCDLDALIHTCISMVESAARKKGLRLTSAIDPPTPRRVMLARDLVEQVLINLLMNAVKYTAKGTVSSQVSGDATGLRFEIADTGPGVAEGKRKRLFRAYDRLGVVGAEGTGLGLSISERFVHRMGGRIGQRDNPGGGSVFWFEIPTQAPTAGMVVVKAPAAPPAETRNLRILLADDLDLTRSVTAEFLRSAGHVVTEVEDGQRAVEAAAVRTFDVILTDMRMPIMDGLETARRIRDLPDPRGRTPIVLVTADLAALHEGASGEAGIDHCLMKPFTRPELLGMVMAATQGAGPSVVRADPATARVLNEAVIEDLREQLGEAAFSAHTQAATLRVEDLLTLLDQPDGSAHPDLRDAVHDLSGVAGLLGLTNLGICLRRVDVAVDSADAREALKEATTDAVRALRGLLSPALAQTGPNGSGSD